MSSSIEKRKRQFAELLDAHGHAVLGMLRRMARNDHDSDDAFQETAIRVWKSMDRAPRLRSPRAWLMTIAYRTFLDLQTKKRPKTTPLTEDSVILEDSSISQAAHLDEVERLIAMVAELPEKSRQVVVLHYTSQLSLKQTAAVMGLPIGTVKSRLNQALQVLRGKLQ